MAPPPPVELTLILAATSRQMGIGLNGQLPWTGLKKEMAYFARVTKRILPPSSSPSPSYQNAVIMGRKTWDSIPPKFRPLKGRVNIVISRSHNNNNQQKEDDEGDDGVVRVGSLGEAVGYIRDRESSSTITTEEEKTGGEEEKKKKISRAFVIGGAQIYGAALEEGFREETRRILLTSILEGESPEEEIECDTFFPLNLGEEGKEGEEGKGIWRKRSKAELDAWTGEEVPGGIQEEGGDEEGKKKTRYEFQMWERD